MVMPGDNIEMTVDLIAPIALEEGTKFSIREGGRTVGAGVVATITKIILYYSQKLPPDRGGVFLCLELSFMNLLL